VGRTIGLRGSPGPAFAGQGRQAAQKCTTPPSKIVGDGFGSQTIRTERTQDVIENKGSAKSLPPARRDL
jgi:hypothetical protein